MIAILPRPAIIAASLWSRRRVAICCVGPWQAQQLSRRMGLTSRSKSTSAARAGKATHSRAPAMRTSRCMFTMIYQAADRRKCCLFLRSISACRARRRAPAHGIRLLLEMCARDEGLRKISRVLDNGLHHQPLLVGIGVVEHVDVLGHRCLIAIGHAILTQVAGTQARRHHLER